MTARDPKRDPQPGDVVCVGFDCRTVLEITQGGAVRYRGDRFEGICSVAMWRAWCGGAAAYRAGSTTPRNTPSKWNAKRLARLSDMMARGLTYDEIAGYFGVTAKAIQSARRKYKLPARHRGWKPKHPKAVVAPVPVVAPAVVPGVMESSIPWPTREQKMGGR